MQLNVTTDYAIRMTLFLAILGTPMGSEDISKQMGIPKQMIAQIAKPLRNAGIIATKRGVGGGFSLNRKPEDISLADIFNAVEGTTRINRCLEEDCYCSRHATETCPVRKFYKEMQTFLDEAFSGKTIASLM